MISSSQYTAGAVCLPQQLALVNSSCPIILIYDDTDKSLPLSLLESAYGGTSNLVPLSQLKARWYGNTTGRHVNNEAQAVQAKVGNMHQKLWLWALPMQLVVYLDIDTLVLRNLDSLLKLNVTESRIGACTCRSRFKERFFNSGVSTSRSELQL